MSIVDFRLLRVVFVPFIAAAAVGAAGCSSSDDSPSSAGGVDAALRPGVEDSSKEFRGTPSAAERAFWQSVRDGDDAARQKATADMKADVASDPTNGYSAFLATASGFIPGVALPRALAAGGPLPEADGPPPADTGLLVTQAIEHLTDPVYLGFAYTFLAAVQEGGGDGAAADASRKAAITHNPTAGLIGQVTGLLLANDVAGATETMMKLFDHCNGGTLDRQNPDVEAYVDKANAGGMADRQCSSGYLAPHATEGYLLLVGDLHAGSGNTRVANLFYKAMRRAENYESWPLRPLAERRFSGAQPVKSAELTAIVACTSCHTKNLP